MTSAKQVVSNTFGSPASERLIAFLRAQEVITPGLVPLTPDASTRNYFRVGWRKGTAVAAVYAEPFDPDFHPYLDTTRLFAACDIPVPEVYAVDGANGIIVLEDLGERPLISVLETAPDDECEHYKEQAIKLIARIQKATEHAKETQSIASRLAFDEAKLTWELEFFLEHYFGSLRGERLRHAEAAELKAELNDLAAELAAAPRVLCHRDFHAANLMVDDRGNLRVIDHQDARMGPACYDLVSFLLDRQPVAPTLAELRAHRLAFLEDRRLQGLDTLDPDDFAYQFRMMTIQRELKAIGTFSYQTAVCGRGAVYEQHIPPTLHIVLQAADWVGRFPTLRRMIRERLETNV
jgi:aminoglycoside/choline kinase family phosphotransferase